MPPKTTPFQKSHPLKYAVEVTSISLDTKKEVVGAACKFCIFTGGIKECIEIVGDKRRREKTEKIKFFTSPFLPEKYVSHHKHSHPTAWMEYETMNSIEKVTFFEKKTAPSSQLTNYFGFKEDIKVFYIRKEIIDILIKDNLLQDLDPNLSEKALSIFKKPFTFRNTDDENFYCVQIEEFHQFNLTVIKIIIIVLCNLDIKPDYHWWIITYYVAWLTEPVRKLVTGMQGKQLILSQANGRLEKLTMRLVAMTGASGPFADDAAIADFNRDNQENWVEGQFGISISDVTKMLSDNSPVYIQECIAELNDEGKESI
jgi:hypothetical protein